jgi:hypothetical protein
VTEREQRSYEVVDTRMHRDSSRPPSRGTPLIAMCLALLSTACTDGPLGPERDPIEDLPHDLAAVLFTASGRPTSPYVLLEIQNSPGFRGFVAVDGQGRPVWYFRTVGGPLGATQRANGNFVFLDSSRGLVEVTAAGHVIHELRQEPRPGRFVHHDVAATPQNTILFIAEDARPWPDTLVTGDAVWEWLPETGETWRRWSSFDELVPELDRGPRSRATDWVHANSVSIGPTGRILVSSPFLNQVLGIAPDFGSLEWRLGGVRATISVDDAFSGQHTAAEVSPGHVLVFDNGFERVEERYSRAVEYEIIGTTARNVWEWRPPRDNWSTLISSARRLPNGNTLIGFGLRANANLGSTGPIEVYEVSPAGDILWHLVLDGAVRSMYRATPLWEF